MSTEKLDYASPETQKTTRQSGYAWISLLIAPLDAVAIVVIGVAFLGSSKAQVKIWEILHAGGGLLIALVGLSFGIAGIRAPNRRKEIAILATVANFLLACWTIYGLLEVTRP